ncbi:PREDICTED: neuronal growth regulator 1 [Pygoscelis adeliae]|uniref:neuronal growth regulator 1 n=1 Tax=Pygoscelis adeliae TaxID=9238 RepID=UPI0004F4D7AB|nr:PREDICTED: neuronal growth regulator 1 [Pygoscelis adeliae]
MNVRGQETPVKVVFRLAWMDWQCNRLVCYLPEDALEQRLWEGQGNAGDSVIPPHCADKEQRKTWDLLDEEKENWYQGGRKEKGFGSQADEGVVGAEAVVDMVMWWRQGTCGEEVFREKKGFQDFLCYLEDVASKGAWLNRSSIIFAGSDKWSVDPRVSIATANRREYSLQIQDVDVTDDGPYTCSVQTQHTPRTMQVHLTVQVSPKIFRISSDIVVNEGSNVTLVCLATGKPEPSISWRHISPSAKPFESGQYLDIYGITRDQSGEYECSAENDVSVPDVKKVKVTVNFAPTIQELKSSGVMLGGNGLIRCEGAGVPAPVFEWYKGERKLINGQQGITIKNYSTRSLLTVTNVTEEHFGNYTCVAANKLGTTNASLPLNPPSTAQYGITGDAEVLFSCWYLVLTLSSLTSIFYLKNIILH